MADEKNDESLRAPFNSADPNYGAPAQPRIDPLEPASGQSTPLNIFTTTNILEPTRTVEVGLVDSSRRKIVPTTHVYLYGPDSVESISSGDSQIQRTGHSAQHQLFPNDTDESIRRETNGLINDYSHQYDLNTQHPAFQSLTRVKNTEYKTFSDRLSRVMMTINEKRQRWSGAVLASMGKARHCDKCGGNFPARHVEWNRNEGRWQCAPMYKQYCKAGRALPRPDSGEDSDE